MGPKLFIIMIIWIGGFAGGGWLFALGMKLNKLWLKILGTTWFLSSLSFYIWIENRTRGLFW